MQHQLGHTPLAAIRLARRDVLEGNHVARHGSKVLVPEPFGRLLVSRDAAGAVGAHELGLLLAGLAAEALSEAGADDDDVARLEGDALLLGDGLDVLDGDLVVVEGVEGDAVLVCEE